MSLRKILRFRVRYQLSQPHCLSLFLAMSSRVYLLFSPRGHEPPPTLRGCFNPHLSLQCRRFPILRYAKRPDVAPYAIGPLFIFPTPSSPHCTLKVCEHDSLWQPPAAHSDERLRSQTSSRAHHRLNALTPDYLKGAIVRGHPMVWYFVLFPDSAKQDPVVYGGVWCSIPAEGSTYCIHIGGLRLP